MLQEKPYTPMLIKDGNMIERTIKTPAIEKVVFTPVAMANKPSTPCDRVLPTIGIIPPTAARMYFFMIASPAEDVEV